MVANYDLVVEEKLRWMSWYDFNFFIWKVKRRNDAIEQD